MSIRQCLHTGDKRKVPIEFQQGENSTNQALKLSTYVYFIKHLNTQYIGFNRSNSIQIIIDKDSYVFNGDKNNDNTNNTHECNYGDWQRHTVRHPWLGG